MAAKTKAAKTKAAKTKAGKVEPLHDGPILALAIVGERVVTAGGDGRVVLRDLALAPLHLLHEDETAPITALTAWGARIVGAGKSLVVWDLDGSVIASAKLPGVAADVVANGEIVYVLAGGKVLAFEGPKLKATGSWRHAAGVACALDVDALGKRALVVRDNELVELIDLKKGKSVADWTRKRKSREVTAIGVRFGAAGEVLCMAGDFPRLVRVKDSTGRVTGEVRWFEAGVHEALAVDETRGFAAIGISAEDVEVVDIAAARTVFFLDAELTDGHTKALTSLRRIPTFKQIAPGFFARHGSVAAPVEPTTRCAMALGAGGRYVAAGYVSGEVLMGDAETGRVVSTHRGVRFEGRCRFKIASDGVSVAREDDASDVFWLFDKEGRITIIDLATCTARPGPAFRLERVDERALLTIAADSILGLSRERVTRWSREDGKLTLDREIPPNKGCFVDKGRVVYLPLDTITHEGCEVHAIDLATGETTQVTRFERDATRFALGRDPKGWVAFGRIGDQPALTIWAGAGLTIAQVFAFDLASGRLGEKLAAAKDASGGLVIADVDASGFEVRDLRTGEVVQRYPFATGQLDRKVDVHPKTFVIACARNNKRLDVWTRDGELLGSFAGHRAMQSLAVGSRGVLARDWAWWRLWEYA